MTPTNKDKPYVYHSLLDRKLRARIVHFLNKRVLVGYYGQNLSVHVGSKPSCARGCRRLFTKEIQAICLLSFVLVLRSLLFKRSGRARFAGTSAKGCYISDTVLTVRYRLFTSRYVCARGIYISRGPTINWTIPAIATGRHAQHDSSRENEISCCHV